MSTKHARMKRRSEMGELGKKAKVVSLCGHQYLCLHCHFNGFKDKSPNAWEDANKCLNRATQRCSRHHRPRHVISCLASSLTPILKGYAVDYESRPSRRFMALQLSECILRSVGQNRAGRVVEFCQRKTCEVIIRMSSISHALSECLSASLCQKNIKCGHIRPTVSTIRRQLELQAYHEHQKQNNPKFFQRNKTRTIKGRLLEV